MSLATHAAALPSRCAPIMRLLQPLLLLLCNGAGSGQHSQALGAGVLPLLRHVGGNGAPQPRRRLQHLRAHTMDGFCAWPVSGLMSRDVQCTSDGPPQESAYDCENYAAECRWFPLFGSEPYRVRCLRGAKSLVCDLEGTNNKWSNDGLTISGFIVLGRESTGLDSGAKSLFVNAVRWELAALLGVSPDQLEMVGPRPTNHLGKVSTRLDFDLYQTPGVRGLTELYVMVKIAPRHVDSGGSNDTEARPGGSSNSTQDAQVAEDPEWLRLGGATLLVGQVTGVKKAPLFRIQGVVVAPDWLTEWRATVGAGILAVCCCISCFGVYVCRLRRRVKRQAKFLERLGASNWREWLQLRRGSSGSDSNSQPGRAKFSPLDSAPGELSEEEVLGQAPVPAETDIERGGGNRRRRRKSDAAYGGTRGERRRQRKKKQQEQEEEEQQQQRRRRRRRRQQEQEQQQGDSDDEEGGKEGELATEKLLQIQPTHSRTTNGLVQRTIPPSPSPRPMPEPVPAQRQEGVASSRTSASPAKIRRQKEARLVNLQREREQQRNARQRRLERDIITGKAPALQKPTSFLTPMKNFELPEDAVAYLSPKSLTHVDISSSSGSDSDD